jgi:hypothetical protein
VRDEDYDRVLVSDAGKPFQILAHGSLGFVAQSIRATDILWDRVWQLERENFGDQNGFFFAAITRIVDPAEDPHALHPVVQAQVASLRTDLDRFSDLEVAAIVRHGYEVARATHRQIADRSDVPVHDGPAWDPLPGRHELAGTALGYCTLLLISAITSGRSRKLMKACALAAFGASFGIASMSCQRCAPSRPTM